MDILVFSFTSALVCWYMCFLLADAHIFGADASLVKSYYADGKTIADISSNELSGIFNIRNKLLRYKKILLFLSCYFCMSLWLAPIAIILTDSVFRLFGHTIIFWSGILQFDIMPLLGLSLLVATLTGIINLIIYKLEQ